MFVADRNILYKGLEYKFCYSSTLEELMCFHVMSERGLHSICGDFAIHLYDQLTVDLQKEIDLLGEELQHWIYVLDMCGVLVEENANYQCDLTKMTKRILDMEETDFIYYMLGLCVTEYHISLKEFCAWGLEPASCKRELELRRYHQMPLEQAVNIVAHTDEYKQRIVKALQGFWNQIFQKEWETISVYVRDIIEHENIALNHTAPIEYLQRFHNQLKLDGNILVFDKTPRLEVPLNQVELLIFTPTIFGDEHLHGNVWGNTVNLNLNLNYKALHISRSAPENFFQRLRALGDESRFKILKVLYQQEATTKEISEILRLSPSTVSIHLKVLRDADMVSCRKVKKFVYYYLKQEWLDNLQRDLFDYLKY